MDFHFNKSEGNDGVLDFHRFVLLFNHSFSSRIRFVGELELEHAFVEGLEKAGEVELELAEGKLSRGEPVDLDLFGRLLGQLRRVLEAIGLERRARPAITLEQYLELTSAPANATNATPPEENQA